MIPIIQKMLETSGFSHVDMNQFDYWLISAKAGAVLVYGIGDLSWSKRAAAESNAPGIAELNGVAEMALDASDRRRVCLTQRRISCQTFEYMATRRAAESSAKCPPWEANIRRPMRRIHP